MDIILAVMVFASIEPRARSTGEVFSLALRLYLRRLPHAVAVLAVVLLPSLLLNGSGLAGAALLGLTAPIPNSPAPDATAMTTLFSALAPLLGLIVGVFWPWAEGALAFSALAQLSGERLGLRAAYGRTRGRWPALWLANLLAQIGVALPLALAGLIAAGVALPFLAIPVYAVFGANIFEQVPPAAFIVLLLVGGLLFIILSALAITLAIQWSLRAPAITYENLSGAAGLSRSVELVRGHRWRMFGRYLLFALLEFALTVLPTIALSALLAVILFPQTFASSGTTNLADFQTALVTIGTSSVAIGTVTTLLVAPLRVIFTAVNYADLRIRKGESLAAQPTLTETPANANALTESLSSYAAPQARDADWRMLDPSRMTPAQRVSLLFRRLRVEGESAELLTEMGFALYEVGDWGNALNAFDRAHALKPDHPRAAYGLMMLYYERRELDLARQMMQAYLRSETDEEALRAVRNHPRFRDLL